MGVLRGSAIAVHLSRAGAWLAPLANFLAVLTPIATLAVFVVSRRTALPTTIPAVYVCVLTGTLMFLLVRQGARHGSRTARLQEQHGQALYGLREQYGHEVQAARECYGRQALYAPAITPLKHAFIGLSNASLAIADGDLSETLFQYHLQQAVRSLAEAFTLVTETSCRVAVKQVLAGDVAQRPQRELDVQVITICRSGGSGPERRWPEDRDRVGNNTDFRRLFTGERSYFFCDDLPAELPRGYQNSHWTEEIIRTGSFEYRSTIVWRIARSYPVVGSQITTELLGFLCVDSPGVGVFNETFDVPLGEAFAQALYVTLQSYWLASGHSDANDWPIERPQPY